MLSSFFCIILFSFAFKQQKRWKARTHKPRQAESTKELKKTWTEKCCVFLSKKLKSAHWLQFTDGSTQRLKSLNSANRLWKIGKSSPMIWSVHLKNSRVSRYGGQKYLSCVLDSWIISYHTMKTIIWRRKVKSMWLYLAWCGPNSLSDNILKETAPSILLNRFLQTCAMD